MEEVKCVSTGRKTREAESGTHAGFFFGFDHLRPAALLGLRLLVALELENNSAER